MRGVSLIELMIGMVLGLIVVAAVFNVYTGTARSARFSDGLQTLQENGRHGIGVLQRGLRLAGYSTTVPLVPLDIAGADATGAGATTVIVNTTAASDCAGGSTAATGGVASNVYRFDPARNAITCAAVGTAETDAIELIDDVDAFRVLYGLDEDDDGTPERFVPWSAGLAPRSVAALRVALLVNSGSPIRARERAQDHAMLDVVETLPADRLVRHVFQSTVLVRNRP